MRMYRGVNLLMPDGASPNGPNVGVSVSTLELNPAPPNSKSEGSYDDIHLRTTVKDDSRMPRHDNGGCRRSMMVLGLGEMG